MGVAADTIEHEPATADPGVPAGCKRTESVLIPEDWNSAELGSCINLLTGFPFPSSGYVDSGVLLVRGSNVKRGKLDWQRDITKYWPEISLDVERYALEAGDLVVAMDGALVGHSYAVMTETDVPSLLLQRVARVRSTAVDLRLLTYWVASEAFVRHVESVKTHTAIPHISPRDIRHFPLVLPTSRKEQEAIAEALSDVDGLIGALEALIAKKRAIKQAAMQQLLTAKTRLPGFTGEWEDVPLGELGTFLKGAGVKRDDSGSGAIACVRYGEIYTTHHDYIRDFQSWISAEVAATATRLKVGDLLFAGSGETKEEIGKCVAFVSDIEAYAGGDIVILRPDQGNSLFLGYALNMPSVSHQKASLGQGDAVVHISAGALAQIKLSLPKPAEQEAIAKVLTDMDTEIAALEQRLNKTRAIKQGMMQQLLTGRVRLGILERDVEEEQSDNRQRHRAGLRARGTEGSRRRL